VSSLEEKVIGILGGMGPETTEELFRRIIKATPAEKDQDHIRVIIYSDPKIPDRTAAIIGAGRNPVPEMRKAAENLEKAGADFIIIPCITAHYYYEELKEMAKIPILNTIELTAQTIEEKFPDAKKLGVIASTGTVLAGIYNRALARKGILVVYPPEELQAKVMEAIYNIKAGRILEGKKIIVKVTANLIEKGAEIIIFGCTEISLVLKSQKVLVPVVDPLQILAERAVAMALRRDHLKP
jgi:aspartate racemase